MPRKSSQKKPRPKSSPRPEARVRLRIICLGPPEPRLYGARFGLQDNSSTAEWVIHEGAAQPNGDLIFECECRVKPNPRTGAPSFLGPLVHGTAAERFLYLSWRPEDWRPGMPEPASACWVRRIKVHLRSISWTKIEKALKSGGVLEAAVEGTGRDGGPSCASVKLVGGGFNVKTGATSSRGSGPRSSGPPPRSPRGAPGS